MHVVSSPGCPGLLAHSSHVLVYAGWAHYVAANQAHDQVPLHTCLDWQAGRSGRLGWRVGLEEMGKVQKVVT